MRWTLVLFTALVISHSVRAAPPIGLNNYSLCGQAGDKFLSSMGDHIANLSIETLTPLGNEAKISVAFCLEKDVAAFTATIAPGTVTTITTFAGFSSLFPAGDSKVGFEMKFRKSTQDLSFYQMTLSKDGDRYIGDVTDGNVPLPFTIPNLAENRCYKAGVKDTTAGYSSSECPAVGGVKASHFFIRVKVKAPPPAKVTPTAAPVLPTAATDPSTAATDPSTATTDPSTAATSPSMTATDPSTTATDPSTTATPDLFMAPILLPTMLVPSTTTPVPVAPFTSTTWITVPAPRPVTTATPLR